jgi:hypothetical protein
MPTPVAPVTVYRISETLTAYQITDATDLFAVFSALQAASVINSGSLTYEGENGWILTFSNANPNEFPEYEMPQQALVGGWVVYNETVGVAVGYNATQYAALFTTTAP